MTVSDLTRGNVFWPRPQTYMIRLSVEYRQDSKILIRLWKSLVGDTPTAQILSETDQSEKVLQTWNLKFINII